LRPAPTGGNRKRRGQTTRNELVPNAMHVTEQFANNRIEADHARVKARLRPCTSPIELRSSRS
jgi:transposase-like protein